jgi:hypothetical protein
MVNPDGQVVMDVQRFVTGPVIAVKGKVLESGVLEVNGFCYLNMPPQIKRPVVAKGTPPRYVCLISGLRVGDARADPLAVQMWVDYVTGFGMGGEVAASIVQVIIAGQVGAVVVLWWLYEDDDQDDQWWGGVASGGVCVHIEWTWICCLFMFFRSFLHLTAPSHTLSRLPA